VRRTIYILGYLFLPILAFCQGQPMRQIKDYYYLYRVKQIDEFTERFNDISTTVRKQHFEEFKRKNQLSHKQMVESLFNKQNSKISLSAIDSFSDFVCDSSLTHPLSLEDTSWYAEAKAKFIYKNKKMLLTLFFHVNRYNNGTFWMIAGIKGLIPPTDIVYNRLDCAQPNDTAHYIPLSSSSTCFVYLKKILTQKICPDYYIEPKLLISESGQNFVNSILNGKLKFEYIDTIKYHYIYLNKLEFDVEFFSRDDFNSGWLINDLKLLDNERNNKNLRNYLAFDTSSLISKKDSDIILIKIKSISDDYKFLSKKYIQFFMQDDRETSLEIDTTIFMKNCIIEDSLGSRGKKNAYKVIDYFRSIADLFYRSENNNYPIEIGNWKLIAIRPKNGTLITYVKFSEKFLGEIRENNEMLKPGKVKNRIAEIVFSRYENTLSGRISRIFSGSD
jgi:hypothetical protein